MKDQTQQMVPPWFDSKEVVFKDHIDQEDRAVINIVFRDKQTLVKHLEQVSQILIKRRMVNNEKLIVEGCEIKEDDFCIHQHGQNHQP